MMTTGNYNLTSLFIRKARSFFRIIAPTIVSMLPGKIFRSSRRIIYCLVGYRVAKTANIERTAKLICGEIEIGEGTYIGDYVILTGGRIIIGKNCDIAARSTIHAGTHHVGSHKRRAGIAISGKISIGEGTWIGTCATIISDTHIETGSIVGAGCVVRPGKYDSNILIVGNPSIVVKTYD